ncbi:MAG: bifunctional demethylmenaquinone methyltransferase/2-methoxy-6-polyprenyl-1,4-benzoquinol methylase UbiE [Verrucomicrobia bacterium]|nr:bifunctional demethylmenaquinone methyltransferase/2-methoxy-6-polyprenyl-1,4-benzoquinol methylase UbiE [Verrucomicrobiota bacterium]
MLEIPKMFDRISPTYDKINRILSMGMDLRWRKKVARHLPTKKNLHVLDLATGTADQLICLFESKASIASAIGIDLASDMLSLGEAKIGKKDYAKQIELQVGDAMAIPFEKGQFDACTFSFGIRNVKDPLVSLEEIWRVLKPKGRCLVLEFSLPPFPILGPYLFYLRKILPWLGGKLSRQEEAYRYLNRTIESFPSDKAFLSLMRRAGFSHCRVEPMALGAVSLYIGEK